MRLSARRRGLDDDLLDELAEDARRERILFARRKNGLEIGERGPERRDGLRMQRHDLALVAGAGMILQLVFEPPAFGLDVFHSRADVAEGGRAGRDRVDEPLHAGVRVGQARLEPRAIARPGSGDLLSLVVIGADIFGD
ncbi:MAG: hypothetical protein QM651_02260 [Rhodoblastus sp.]